ncbi:acetyltransferase (GNAT) family protein [Salsuginibacillus halophilus]|uniref:Acetyltransferase (GNAT) family protein n=1 Tax=Salsuginibacillus halophilus TaxID=517424 RepID=A0A2P8HAL1_9BACI|nr:GNAT family N-acetyltransferase [Salsuginibacillus halophilus]PSL43209.1 acetyltransferase (GNAT) family protein [Salsuginibacillus halophilus]
MFLQEVTAVDEALLNRFKCSNNDDKVGSYLRNEAVAHHKKSLTKTHVVTNGEEIIGFYAMFADSVQVFKNKIQQQGWGLGGKQKQFPAVRIHYMGVDQKFEGQGYGSALLYSALDVIYEMNEFVGINFIALEAINGTEEFYQQKEFVHLYSVNRDLNMMVLKIESIQD